VPYNIVYEVPEGTPKRNWTDVPHEVSITSIRGHEGEYTLDKNGFQLDKRVHQEKEFVDDERIKEVYYPSVIEAVKELTGGYKVIVFDHTIRRDNGSRNPVMAVHVDQTAESAAGRVRRHAAEEAEELLKHRFQIINYWKPIKGPVLSYPLAYGDATTVKEEDVVSVQHRYKDWVGSTASVKYNPNQRFYYTPEMAVDEALLLKCFDSKKGVASRTPHTAFKDPLTPENAPGRESIEVRTLVFFKE